MTYNKKVGVLGLILGLVCTLWGMFFIQINKGWDSVHGKGDGEAAYLEGSHCTINMEADDKVDMELNERYIWCTLRHMDYLDSLNKK